MNFRLLTFPAISKRLTISEQNSIITAYLWWSVSRVWSTNPYFTRCILTMCFKNVDAHCSSICLNKYFHIEIPILSAMVLLIPDHLQSFLIPIAFLNSNKWQWIHYYAYNIPILSVSAINGGYCITYRRVRHPHKKGCIPDDTKVFLVVRLLFWTSGECRVTLYYHYF